MSASSGPGLGRCLGRGTVTNDQHPPDCLDCRIDAVTEVVRALHHTIRPPVAYESIFPDRGFMPRLSQLLPQELTINVPMGATENLSVTYRPHVLSTALQERFKDALADGEVTAQLVDPMCELLVRWDLMYDDREEIIPITADALVVIPLAILSHVFTTIVDESRAAVQPRKGRPVPLRRA